MTATTTIRFAGAAQGFNWLPVFVAEERGLFAQHGLSIEFHKVGSVEKATAAVRDGDADLAITPPEGAVADHLAGGSLRIIGSNAERLPMSMVARPGIAELAELRGARIGTSSMTEGTSIYTRRLLSRAGIDLLLRVIGPGNVLFGSELLGAVAGEDPETGGAFDDTRRYLEAAGLDESDLRRVFEGNARRVYPRLDTRLAARRTAREEGVRA